MQFEGENNQINELMEKMTPEVIMKLKENCDIEPKGILNVSANFKDRTVEGSQLDQYIGVASSYEIEGDFDSLYVEPSLWAVFSICGKYPEALQKTWADIYAKWLSKSNYIRTKNQIL